ncbi:MAG: PASTA domain-containing protein, partial [Gaiellaceae bacterium]
ADAQIARGSAVTIVAAAGPVVKGVPTVLGIAAPLAVRKLRSSGFGATVKSIASPKARGIVFAQDPAAGSKAKPCAAVALSVSKGPAAVAVPNVVGATASDAGAKLRAAGFVATVTTVPSTKPKETVVAQSPAAGQKAAKGSGVRINVSNGAPATTTATVASTVATTTATTATTSAATTSAATTSASTTTAATPPPASSTVTVPDVTGQNQTAAQRTLGRAGLRSTVAYVASSEAAGTVIVEKPADGTKAKRNTRIRLEVSTGPSPKATKPIPDVTSQDEASATQALENAGFVVQSIDEPVTDQSQDGTVVDEQPGGGTQAPSGSQVTIYVGRFSG